MQVGEEGLVSWKREEGRRVCSVGEVWSVMQVAVGVCMVLSKWEERLKGKKELFGPMVWARFGLELS